MRVNFQEVSLVATKSGVCNVCGKQCKRSQKFWETINPFNLNAQGFVKTREEIRDELSEKVAEWQKSPAMHKKCEVL